MTLPYDLHFGRNRKRSNAHLDQSQNAGPTVLLTNEVASIEDDADVSSSTFMADIVVSDDGEGTNVLSLTGTDAADFTIIGTKLYLIANPTALAGPDTLTCTVNVNDTEVAPSPNDTDVFSLTVNAAGGGVTSLLRYHSENILPQTNALDLTAWSDDGSLNKTLDVTTAPLVTSDTPPTGHSFSARFDDANSEYLGCDLTGAAATEINADTVGTFFIRFNLDALPSESFLFSYGHDVQGADYLGCNVLSNGQLRLAIRTNAPGQYWHRTASGAISTATDYILCIRQPADTGGCDMWLNGSSLTLDAAFQSGAGAADDWFPEAAATNGDLERFRLGCEEFGGGGTDKHISGEITFFEHHGTALTDLQCADTTPETL